mmetsp:Transcript_119372/g.323860  ORF Transcript_119372/g.323860 Transcript_119372/m.323860 type:complete len:200 (+) Transcript_119372:1022-1621(+)
MFQCWHGREDHPRRTTCSLWRSPVSTPCCPRSAPRTRWCWQEPGPGAGSLVPAAARPGAAAWRPAAPPAPRSAAAASRPPCPGPPSAPRWCADWCPARGTPRSPACACRPRRSAAAPLAPHPGPAGRLASRPAAAPPAGCASAGPAPASSGSRTAARPGGAAAWSPPPRAAARLRRRSARSWQREARPPRGGCAPAAAS